MQYDVVVIGSGPAAVAAAITCSLQGHSVAMVTKAGVESDGLHKKDEITASQSVHPGIGSLLRSINAEKILLASSRAMYEGIQTGEQYAPLGGDAEGKWKGHHLDRKLFDILLMECAIKQGVVVHAHETVTAFIQESNRITGISTKSGKRFTAKYTIDAGGRGRIAGKKLTFKERYLSAPLVAWTGFTTNINSEIFRSLQAMFIPEKNGWTWLAPEPPASCTWTRLAPKGEKEFLPPAALRAFTSMLPVKIYNMRWRIFRPLCKEGIILCGDAAGILDPAAGQGILNALWSGINAAKTVISCIDHPSFEAIHLAQYDDWYLTQFTEKAEQLQQYYRRHGIML